ncbi:MAG: hypothetical protein IPH07_31530 [Deltaproteobacteria bacterium]|nr:hypothetical protein [Deltaproteobacteria bacterium]MBK8234704.1 hypothetical protein [Deltaproteobacteria bacterium]MBK8715448.1 hypothetical protein [Deltaproteobacteria bacterium]MBP7287664.1 hypothetical protein [Nannocystaceae bacterium]
MRPTRFCTSLLVAAALVLPQSAAASPFSPTALAYAAVEEGGAVLGLESDDAAAGTALTKALRKAFATRGVGGGPEMSLAEMRLTMGCERNDAYKCFAEGGKAIEVRKLVYGKLSKSGGSYQLQLTMLDVATALEQTDSRKLSSAELSSDSIDDTARTIVASMLGDESDAEPVPSAGLEPSGPPSTPEVDKGPTPKREKQLEWGLHKPIPKWKKIGTGVSWSLAIAGVAVGVGLSVALNTSLPKKLKRAVADSVKDAKPSNDIPESAPDYCVLAHESKDGGKTVKNAKVDGICNVANGVEKGQIAAYVGAGVFGAAAIVFTVLLFVRKRPSNAAAAVLRRHDATFGAMPTRGGASVGASFRF